MNHDIVCAAKVYALTLTMKKINDLWCFIVELRLLS